MLKTIKKALSSGLKVVIPFIFIAIVFYWFINWTEQLFGWLISLVVGTNNYYYGSGLLLAIALILGIGLVMQLAAMQVIYQQVETLIKKLPIINSLYRMSLNVFQFLSTKKNTDQKNVVLVNTPIGKVMGVLTNKQPREMLDNNDDKLVAVYIPMSYQIGGFTFLVAEDDLDFLEMNINEAMENIMTALIKSNKT